MAFLNRVGSVLKQAVSKHASSQSPVPSASIFQAIRSMSTSSKLFVGGLSYSTDEQSLREAFSQYGEVVESRVITDRETGRSRGFGFVTFTSTEAASSAIQAFDGQDLHGRMVRVNYATERPRSGGFGGGGFGGGYGGGGGGGGYGGGSSYGGQGGNYGRGGYQGGGGGGYQGGGGGYQGGGGYGSGSQYPSEGSGYGGGGNYSSGGGVAYGGGESAGTNFSSGQTGFSSSNFETTGGIGESQEAVSGQQDGGEDFGQDSFDKNEEPNDYANTRN